jgi:hypothetical protein
MACGDMGSLPDAHGGEFALCGDIGRKDHRISKRARMPVLVLPGAGQALPAMKAATM